MDPLPPPLAFFLFLFSGWVNRQQQAVIDYLLEENRVLRARRDPDVCASPTTSDAAIAGIVTPDTILRWYRRLVAQKYAVLELARTLLRLCNHDPFSAGGSVCLIS